MPLEGRSDMNSSHATNHFAMRQDRLHYRVRQIGCALLTVLILGTLTVSASSAQVRSSEAEDAERLASRLAARYDAIDTMRLRFVQTASSAFMDTDERYSGQLTFSDVAYRIDTSNQTILSDGVTTWVHNRSEGQVIINDFVEDESAFSLTQFLGSFSDDYRSTYQGSELLKDAGHERLRLHPLDDFAAFRQVDLWIRDSDGLVTRLIAVDLNDVRMVFDLSSIEVDPQVGPDEFTFQIPEGVEQIDLREEG